MGRQIQEHLENGKPTSFCWRCFSVAPLLVMVPLPPAPSLGVAGLFGAPLMVLLFFASVARVEWQWSADLAE
jgi:hypothetical protein